MDNISLARRAWPDPACAKLDDRQALFDMLDDDVVLHFTIPEGTPISGKVRGKNHVIDFYTAVSPSLVVDGKFEPGLQYGEDGDTVLVLGVESYTIKKTGVRCDRKEFALVVDFCDEKITGILQIKDFTELFEAYSE